MAMPAAPGDGPDLATARAQLAAARQSGDPRAIVQALLAVCRAELGVELARGPLRDVTALARAADEAWQLAHDHRLWDLVGELALFFGDVARRVRDYPRCYDHYANACAYALAAGADCFWATVERVDDVLTEFVRTGRLLPAVALCELLVGYEELGGLGERVPAFAARYAARRTWLEQLRVEALLQSRAGQH